ncbi:unnamed protein product, partial [Rotaria sp. Silwood2]
MGVLYYDKENYSGALENYEQALSYRMKADGDENYEIANIYNNIGNVHRIQEKYDLALQNLQRCLEIRSKIYPENHPAIAEVLTNIGL